jgi:hypothetical protein
MHPVLSRAKEVLVDVPRHGKLAYCLLRDERVPAWVPLLGELDMLALGVLAVKTFIEACPEDVRREHEEALKTGQSIFDRDFRDTAAAAREGTGHLVNRIRSRLRPRDSYQSVSEG